MAKQVTNTMFYDNAKYHKTAAPSREDLKFSKLRRYIDLIRDNQKTTQSLKEIWE